MLELSILLKEKQKGNEKDEEAEDNEAEEDEAEDIVYDDDDIEDYDEDSEAEEFKETEEEFLERYSKVAVALENGSPIEEGHIEDQEHQTELGHLMDVDQRGVVPSMIEKYDHVLIREQAIPSQLILNFLNAFPGCSSFFQQSR
ncbi:Importin beta-like SAD2-like protein [Quillaja saponaria]|uniref:Importin beta-like SAD2-like protein n=1 Tax=Quillaja saponaria TaxID=32244 RepID=A0AAD7VLR2_QUISA|nr:Importin beta-like SAD2-like protein [Quillaja saponaria]